MSVRLLTYSVRDSVPRADQVFDSVEAAQRYVRTEYATISSYWQVRITDESGALLLLGTRAGPGGTGQRWVWNGPVG